MKLNHGQTCHVANDRRAYPLVEKLTVAVEPVQFRFRRRADARYLWFWAPVTPPDPWDSMPCPSLSYIVVLK
jgi:hypothetical protein